MTEGNPASRWLSRILIIVILVQLATSWIGLGRGGMVAARDATIPDTPVGRQLAWVLTVVNAEAAGPTADGLRERFSEAFLAAVPPREIVIGLRQAASSGPYTLVAIARSATDNHVAVTVTDAAGDPYRVIVGVEGGPPHRITNLELDPVSPLGAPLAGWSDLDARLRDLAPRVSFQAAELRDGACKPVHALNPEERLPIASGFKLYVLGELARQIAAGEASWDEELAIRDDWKNYILTGNMQHEPAGATHTLRHYAEQMIWVSDNTATDHLLGRLGRDQVEAIQAAMGHSEPDRNAPFLTTREFHTLLLLDPEQLDAYLATEPATRAAALADVMAARPFPTLAAADFTPRGADRVGWFAAAGDLCRAMASLQTQFDEPGLAPLREILALDPVAIPALALDPAQWTYVGYKGGRHEGVRSLAWLLQRADGRWFVLSGIFNDPQQSLDNGAINEAMTAAATFLGKSA